MTTICSCGNSKDFRSKQCKLCHYESRKKQWDEDGQVCGGPCGLWKHWTFFSKNSKKASAHHFMCKDCKNAYEKERRKSIPGQIQKDRTRNTRNQLKACGWTPEMKEAALVIQGGVCANSICPNQATDADHDHETGEARGLLCGPCNRALGLLRDSSARVEGLLAYSILCDNIRRSAL